MTKSFTIVCCILVLVLTCSVPSAAPAPKNDKAPAIPKWEYKAVAQQKWTSEEIEKQCNKLGDEGWELVSVVSHSTPASKFQSPSYFFKRLKK